MYHLGGRFFPSQSSKWEHSLTDILTAPLWDHEHQAKLGYAQTPDSQELWHNKYVLF